MRAYSCLLSFIFCFTFPLRAQMTPGDTLRFTVPTFSAQGVVLSVDGDAVTFRTQTANVPRTLTVPRAILKKAEKRAPDLTVEEAARHGATVSVVVLATAALGTWLFHPDNHDDMKPIDTGLAISVPIVITLGNIFWGRQRWTPIKF